MSRSLADLEVISRRAEAMAAQIAEQMTIAHELNDQGQLDWLHSLIQHLVVIRQAALAIREAAEDAGPRVFGVPRIPDEIKHVFDMEGEHWVRRSMKRRTWESDDRPRIVVDEAELIYHYGEVREVRPDGIA